MSVQLLVIYPPPKDPAEFDRAYREEHLPYAGPRLVGATGVTTKRVLGAPEASRSRTGFRSWTSRTPKSRRPARSLRAAERRSSTRLRSRPAVRRNSC